MLAVSIAVMVALNVGSKVRLLGRQFTVVRCREERGTKDDITVWINLAEAQEMLGRKGRISAIWALECRCAWADLAKVRAEIARILPSVTDVQKSSRNRKMPREL